MHMADKCDCFVDRHRCTVGIPLEVESHKGLRVGLYGLQEEIRLSDTASPLGKMIGAAKKILISRLRPVVRKGRIDPVPSVALMITASKPAALAAPILGKSCQCEMSKMSS
jgi:hypothetical protein